MDTLKEFLAKAAKSYLLYKKVTIPVTALVACLATGGVVYGVTQHQAAAKEDTVVTAEKDDTTKDKASDKKTDKKTEDVVEETESEETEDTVATDDANVAATDSQSQTTSASATTTDNGGATTYADTSTNTESSERLSEAEVRANAGQVLAKDGVTWRYYYQLVPHVDDLPAPEYTNYGDYVEICTWHDEEDKKNTLIQQALKELNAGECDWSVDYVDCYTADGTQIVEYPPSNYPVSICRVYGPNYN
jgi:hypothetical protein